MLLCNRDSGTSQSRSVITFDKGASWSFIAPPSMDSNMKPLGCEAANGCSLNLFGLSGYHPYFYSTENAIGLIMATGNVGNHLVKSAGMVNTYLSRDAGWTWLEVAKGSHIYEFGDHGGLIVMVKDSEATNIAYYSWNEGESWSEQKFSETPINVNNIIIEVRSPWLHCYSLLNATI